MSAGLSELGHELGSDEFLKPGADLRVEVQKHLAQADAVVFLVTENSVRSQSVILEISAALAYSREHGGGGVIPVSFDNVELPEIIQHIRAIPADRDNLAKAVRSISDAVGYLVGVAIARAEKESARRAFLEKVAEEYIDKSQRSLEARERSYRFQANVWYAASCAVLLFGVSLGVARLRFLDQRGTDLYSLLEVLVLAGVIVGLIVAIAKFCFTSGKSCMVESLRNADRRHAISFGEFYLKSFGREADWGELKDAFQHWNIDSGSAFGSQSVSDFDPKLLEAVAALAQVVGRAKKEK